MDVYPSWTKRRRAEPHKDPRTNQQGRLSDGPRHEGRDKSRLYKYLFFDAGTPLNQPVQIPVERYTRRISETHAQPHGGSSPQGMEVWPSIPSRVEEVLWSK